MSEPIIEVRNISKKYRLGEVGFGTLRDEIANAWHRLRTGKAQANIADRSEFWALRDVSFEVQQGEILGIIGRNGAGKSSLLKILSRITEPTSGEAILRGRVASLLEVGTGFNPELTGRENIYLNGTILGMKKLEIDSKLDEIIAFSEIEQHLDTPVKRYSSGMYVRLAFAVAAHLEPEILIVDEVLAVGDTEFQKKCLGKMQDVSKNQGRTVLFVSHSMAAVRTLCSHAILLNQGKIEGNGNVDTVVESYLNRGGNPASSSWERPPDTLNSEPVFITAVKAHIEGRQPALKLIHEIQLKCVTDSCPKAFIAIDICEAFGTPIMQAEPIPKPFLEFSKGTYLLRIQVDLPPLIPGTYTTDIWIGSHHTSTIDYIKKVVIFVVEDAPTSDRSYPYFTDHGYMAPSSVCKCLRLYDT